MGEEQSISLMDMTASELGYTVKWVQLSYVEVKEMLVLERENGYFHCFLGVNKVELALQWLRREV